MHAIRRFLNILLEANISSENWKFWFNARTSKVLWFGGMEHHAHALYIHANLFGLTDEQIADLAAHPAMDDAPEDENGEPDIGARIIYLPDLFWSVMQRGWVRGGLEGEYGDEQDIMHPYGLYLEGKSLPDIARAANFIAAEVGGDPDDFDDETNWTVESLRIAVRSGPARDAETAYHLGDERAAHFMKTGRIPSKMM